MIHLQMQGLIGNNLFQYAVARILAEDLGYALHVEQSPYTPQKNVPQLLELMSHFRDAPLSLPGKSFEQPVDRRAQMGHEGFDGFRLDLDPIRNDKSERKVMVEGFFERYDVFRQDKDRIRSWFAMDPITLGHDVSRDDVVMHVRRGDFVVFGRAISLSYYLKVLEQLRFRRLYICGFGLDSDVKKTFRRYDPIYVHGEPIDDFRFMKGFNRIVQSQSTFVWWAGFLSDAEEIYAPVPDRTETEFQREFPHIDLRVDDESRYHYVEDVPHFERPFTLRDMVAARKHMSGRAMAQYLRQWLRRRVAGRA